MDVSPTFTNNMGDQQRRSSSSFCIGIVIPIFFYSKLKYTNKLIHQDTPSSSQIHQVQCLWLGMAPRFVIWIQFSWLHWTPIDLQQSQEAGWTIGPLDYWFKLLLDYWIQYYTLLIYWFSCWLDYWFRLLLLDYWLGIIWDYWIKVAIPNQSDQYIYIYTRYIRVITMTYSDPWHSFWHTIWTCILRHIPSSNLT